VQDRRLASLPRQFDVPRDERHPRRVDDHDLDVIATTLANYLFGSAPLGLGFAIRSDQECGAAGAYEHRIAAIEQVVDSADELRANHRRCSQHEQ